MTVIKIIGIIFLFLGCAIYGFNYSNKFDNKLLILDTSVELLNNILINVKYEKLQTEEILKGLYSQEKYKNILCFENCINEGQVEIIKRCINCLSTCTQSQIEIILSDNIELLKNLISQKEQDYKSKSALYKKLGIVCGLMFSIILI